MDFLINKMIKFLNKDQKMDQEREEIIRYGIELFILEAIFIFAVMGVGMVLGYAGESIIFLVLFIPIRSMAGGYHAKTRKKCFILSILMVAGAIELLKIMMKNTKTALLIAALSSIFGFMMWCISPVENENKKISEKQKVLIRRKMRIHIVVEFLITSLLFYKGYHTFFYLMCIAVLMAGLLVFVEFMKNKIV